MLLPYEPLSSPGSSLLSIPNVRTKTHSEPSFQFYSPHLWNNLPEDLRVEDYYYYLTYFCFINYLIPIIFCLGASAPGGIMALGLLLTWSDRGGIMPHFMAVVPFIWTRTGLCMRRGVGECVLLLSEYTVLCTVVCRRRG